MEFWPGGSPETSHDALVAGFQFQNEFLRTTPSEMGLWPSLSGRGVPYRYGQKRQMPGDLRVLAAEKRGTLGLRARARQRRSLPGGAPDRRHLLPAHPKMSAGAKLAVLARLGSPLDAGTERR